MHFCDMGHHQDKNANGNGHSVAAPWAKKRSETLAATTKTAVAPAPGLDADGVMFKTSDGIVLRGPVGRIQRHTVAFELYGPLAIPRLSESLADFKIVLHNRVIYAGHAVVSDIVDAGSRVICKVNLELLDWIDLDLLVVFREGQAEREIGTFLKEWQKNYKILDEFKIVVADMQTFFHDLQLLLDRTELRLQAQSPRYREDAEVKIAGQLAGAILPLIDYFFERFEDIAGRIPEDEKSPYMNYMRQRLHPLVLGAPFANHTFSKPRGYAGDFDMVKMIERNGFEGKSLFAKIVHKWFVQQPPAEAHRNRIKYLADCIETQVHRASLLFRRPARIRNFACGPAMEIQRFTEQSILAGEAEFTLEDFDDHALSYCRNSLMEIITKRRLDTTASFEKKSVFQLIKESQTPASPSQKTFDLVYCAGLFDYLAENTCRQMMDIFYDSVLPGGLLIATNVNSTNPLRYGMEHLLDWHLIYRNEIEFRAVAPRKAASENVRVYADETGVNLFLEIRKPENG